ncbi:MAG: hypothetical protein GYB32_04505 [Algicola sp.]|nr:hypothetical protein [Algicola sp.]
MNKTLVKALYKWSSLFIYIAVAICCISRSAMYLPDSEGYLNMSIIRSAAYPLFLNTVKLVFGSWFETAIVILQTLLGLLAVDYFIKKIKAVIHLHNLWYLLLTILLLTPYVYNHLVANYILSEALAYPLYLVIVAQLMCITLTKNPKDFKFALPLMFILMLTRSQFLYLVPVAMLVWFYISYRPKSYKLNTWLLIALICLPFLTSLADKSYHSLKHDYFVSTPWTGIVVISAPLYVADEEDATVFTSESEQEYFNKVYEALQRKHLNIYHLDPAYQSETSLPYINSYTSIANETVLPVAQSHVGNQLSYNETLIEVDQLTRQMAMPLLLDNFKPWCQLYLKNVIHAFGNARYFLLMIMLLLAAMISVYRTTSHASLAMALGLLLLFANIAVVAIGIHTVKRYTFYNDWVIFFVLFVLIHAFMHPKNTIEKPQ